MPVIMFLISIAALKKNTSILRQIRTEANCHVVLALKGFSCWKAFPFIREDLDGCCASGLWEAQLARDYFQKHIITYSPAYQDEDIDALCAFTDHLDFNSLSQWFRYREKMMAHPRFQSGELQCGLRINPQCSTGKTAMYDPCVAGSRLGITADQLLDADLTGISGLHFHTLCEQGADDLETTMHAVHEKFGHWLETPSIRYLNMGGGHWITKPDYDRQRLINLVKKTQERYQLDVWLEPGEAVAIHSGVLRAEVLDIFESAGHRLVILDISATAHMPDVIEMPYRPELFLVDHEIAANANSPQPAVILEGEHYHHATESGEWIYRLGAPTCLSGDVIGDYAFHRPLRVGDQLVFDDMAHYTMVKTTTFNGVKHPSIALQHEDGKIEVIREFSYADFRDRLS